MKSGLIKKLAVGGLLTALVFLATYFLKIPITIPGGSGYLNLGDVVIIASVLALDWKVGAVAAILGSTLADIAGGWLLYAPFTFVIKGVMAIIIWLVSLPAEKVGKLKPLILLLAAVAGEAIMIGGYFVADLVIYGWLPLPGMILPTAVINLPFSAIQAVAGVVVGLGLGLILIKYKLRNMLETPKKQA